MVDSVSFEGIAEVSITLAGFSGLLMMLRSGPVQRWHPRARFPFWCTLAFSLGALFFSYLPSVLEPFGITEWALPNLLLAAFLSGATTRLLLVHRRLTRQGAPTQSPFLLGLHVAITYLASVIVLGSAVGFLNSPGLGWYRLGVITCVFAALPPFLASFRVRDEPTTGLSGKPN